MICNSDLYDTYMPSCNTRRSATGFVTRPLDVHVKGNLSEVGRRETKAVRKLTSLDLYQALTMAAYDYVKEKK